MGNAKPQTFHGATFILRPFRAEDAGILCETICANQADLERWTPIPFPYRLDDATRWIATSFSGPNRAYAIWHDHGNAFAGSVGLLGIDPGERRAELAYWIDKKRRGWGLATHAAELLIDAAFAGRVDGLLIDTLGCSHLVENHASAAVMARIGFEHEGERPVTNPAHGMAKTTRLTREGWERRKRSGQA